MTRVAFAFVFLAAAPLWAAARAGRLSSDVVPTRYAITLAPDLARGTFAGREAIDVDVAQPTTRITLNAYELAIVDARVVVGGDSQDAGIESDAAHETLTLVLKRPVSAGRARIILGWNSPLEDDLIGFYRAEAAGRHYAFTHFEPAAARRAFPCFDEPGLKARVSLTALVDAADDAVSNAPIAQVTPLPDGRKLVEFAETPPLPPYLVALAVGRFSAISRVVDGVTVRVLALPEQVSFGAFALDEATQLVPRFAGYFDARFPFAKLDLVAVPALVPGGMENAGAIFLRDDRVLLDAAEVSPAQLHATAQLIAHEIAHQWLGDLVTPRWWNDLWLSEATATFAANEVLDELHPDWRPWREFQEPLDEVMDEDELRATHPVRTPIADGATASDAFDGTTYVKGAAILRMLDAWLGAGTIRHALRAYLHPEPYSVADADAFFAALDAAAARPASTLARTWLERAGHPLVSVSARCQDDALVVTLAQSRAGADAAYWNAPPWPIPMTLRWPGGSRTLVLAGDTDTFTLAGCPAWIEANGARSGFYRVRYAAPLAAALADAAPRALDDTERVALISDAWSDARAGASSPADFLLLVRALRGERSPAVMAQLTRRLTFIDEELTASDTRADFARFVAAELTPQYRALGFQPRAAEDDDTRLVRAQVIDLLGRVARMPDVIAAADHAFARYLHDARALDPALTPVVLDLAARHGGAERFAQFLHRSQGTHSPEEQRRYLEALAAFGRPDLLRRTLALLLTGAVPPQDLMSLVAALMARGREASATAWEFLRDHFDALAQRVPRLGWLLAPAGHLCDERAARQVSRFFGEVTHRPSTRRRLLQAEESIVECAALRRRATAPLAAWLRARRH